MGSRAPSRPVGRPRLLDIPAPPGLIRCRLCGRDFRVISPWHLFHKHGWDPEHPVEEYKRRFRLTKAWGTESRRKQGASRRAYCDRVGRRWTPASVVETLRRRAAAGKPVNEREIRREKLWSLRTYANRFFGSCRRAVDAAHAEVRGYRQHGWWIRRRVVEAVRARREAGKPVNASAVRDGDPALYCAARKRLGSWKATLAAAGIPRKDWKAKPKPRVWTAERVVEALRERHRAGKPVNATQVFRECKPLYCAAYRHLGGWHRALAAAGIPAQLRGAS